MISRFQIPRSFNGPGAFLTPVTVFMVFVFCIPMMGIVWTSVYDGGFSFTAYENFFAGKLFRQAFINTLVIALSSGAVSVFFGYFVALHLSRMTPRRRAMYMMLVMLPFWTSILVKSYAFVVILGTNGILNSVVQWIFSSETVLPLLFNRAGVIIGMTHWLLPFAVFPILSSLIAQDRTIHAAAEVMGARPMRIFWNITFPLSLPGVIGAMFITSVIAMGSFVTPALLGGRKDLMMANLVDFYIREVLDWQMASTIAVVLILVAGAVLVCGSLTRMQVEKPSKAS